MSIPRRHIEALVPGGVPDMEARMGLVAELLVIGDENPELDVEELGETILKAARALWADGIYIGADMDPSVLASEKVTEIDGMILQLKSQQALAENSTPEEARNQGVEVPDFYRGAIAALQDLREMIAGTRFVDIPF